MIGYHWSPDYNRESIYKHGLLIPSRHPKLTEAICCSDGFRNSHVSVARTVTQAWSLSIGALIARRQDGENVEIPRLWDLWEVDITGLKYRPIPRWWEICVNQDVSKSRLVRCGAYFVEADLRYGRARMKVDER